MTEPYAHRQQIARMKMRRLGYMDQPLDFIYPYTVCKYLISLLPEDYLLRLIGKIEDDLKLKRPTLPAGPLADPDRQRPV